MSQSSISDLAAHCIRCGFCLESCPTFLITGKETESPRGRIYLIRSADAGMLKWDEEGLTEHIDACVGCRNCETACPSGVEYGPLLELARANIEAAKPSKGKAFLLKNVTSPETLKAELMLSHFLPGRKVPKFLTRSITREKPQADRPRAEPAGAWPALNEQELPPVRGEVCLLVGCAMGVLFPRVHEATRRLLRRIGLSVKDVSGCCGALHSHNGFALEANVMAENIVARSVGRSLVINSAGCGSFLKEHTGLPAFDISETLINAGFVSRLAHASADVKVTYHDACHLAHGQKITKGPRELIQAIPGVAYVELPEADLCCGSGGIYNLTQPTLARRMLDRKWKNIESTGAEIVITGNPGCHAWIEQRSREAGGNVRVMHTAQFLEEAISGVLEPQQR